IVGGLEYAAALFDRETVQRWLEHWRTLLQAMVHDASQSVDRLALLTAQQREQILVQWNATQAAYPSEQCIHELFEEQVRKTPQALALVYEPQQLSYGQLNERA